MSKKDYKFDKNDCDIQVPMNNNTGTSPRWGPPAGRDNLDPKTMNKVIVLHVPTGFREEEAQFDIASNVKVCLRRIEARVNKALAEMKK